jgi:hypothetical protein
MPYLNPGGTRLFRRATNKTTISIGIFKVGVSGSNLVPIIDALAHFEAMANFADEREAALCSIMSRCRKWLHTKNAKVLATAGDPDATVQVRQRAVTSLLNEASAALLASDDDMARAFDSYSTRKQRGGFESKGLANGYANERSAYVASGKTRSISGSLIDDLVHNANARVGPLLSVPNKAKLEAKFGARTAAPRPLESLTPKEWLAIEKIATELSGRQLQTRYMTRHQRLGCMLESDGAGGLRYAMSLQPPVAAGNGVWPYAMDEWGNIYTANDQAADSKKDYAMFNHSSFTAGDTVVCAGMMKINAAGKLLQIDTNSGHYKPTKRQLQIVVTILRDEYLVDLALADIVTMPDGTIWSPGESLRFLTDLPPQ